MARGRRSKVVKPPTRHERTQGLQERIVGLRQELAKKGFGTLLKIPGPINLVEEADFDPKTGGSIGKVKEPLGTYIQRVSVEDNYSQRPPFDHLTDSIYKRLIRDFITGAAMPESKVAALGRSNQKAGSLTSPGIHFSVIDGLQRLYCFCIAILLVLEREKLVSDSIIPPQSWDYFKETLQALGDPHAATEAILRRDIRYEVFFNIDLGGLLHYMVTFNTGQRHMSLPVQLEIMQSPLIQELQDRGLGFESSAKLKKPPERVNPRTSLRLLICFWQHRLSSRPTFKSPPATSLRNSWIKTKPTWTTSATSATS